MDEDDALKAWRFFKKELNILPDSLEAKVGALFISLKTGYFIDLTQKVDSIEEYCVDLISFHANFFDCVHKLEKKKNISLDGQASL